MANEGPYRAAKIDSSRLGWIEKRVDARATLFMREQGPGMFAGLATAASVVGVARGLISTSTLTLAVASALGVGILAMWPLGRETIRIDARGLTWRDRVLAWRTRVTLEKLAVTVVDGHVRIEEQRASDKKLVAFWRVADGHDAEVDALARALNEAIERARV